jgi:hypothetical protein
VNAWAEVDQWARQRLEAKAAALRSWKWRTFAKLVQNGRVVARVRGDGNGKVRFERPCFHSPGKWRATFSSKPKVTPAILVAHDKWLEEGCPVRSGNGLVALSPDV